QEQERGDQPFRNAQEPTRAADPEHGIHPENERAVADIGDQHLRLVLPPFLIAEGQEDDHHRCAQQLVVEILFEKPEPVQYACEDACEGVHGSLLFIRAQNRFAEVRYRPFASRTMAVCPATELDDANAPWYARRSHELHSWLE